MKKMTQNKMLQLDSGRHQEEKSWQEVEKEKLQVERRDWRLTRQSKYRLYLGERTRITVV
jgi:hypothetical protein